LPWQGVDYYYQFKLSEYLSRKNAKHIKDGTYDSGYYRFGLHRRDNNRQHRRLREHCQMNPFTYYVAPEFGGLLQPTGRLRPGAIHLRRSGVAMIPCS